MCGKELVTLFKRKKDQLYIFFFIVILYTPKSPINLYDTKSAFLGFQWVALRKNYVWIVDWMDEKKMEYLVKTAGGVVAEVIENRMF